MKALFYFGLTTAILSVCLQTQAETPATASQLQLMVGAPPTDDRQVTVQNALSPPFNRWSFLHMQELFPTRSIAPAAAPSELPVNRIDISNVKITFAEGRETTAGAWLAEAYTDAFIVLHQGAVVFEQYLNGQRPSTEHIMFSVSKSFTGTLVLMLAEEGLIDLSMPVEHYIPELKDSAFGGASVQQVMDMTNSIAYVETYDDPESDISRYFAAITPGGSGVYTYLTTLRDKLPGYEHGDAFHYVTPDTEVLGWLIRRVTGRSLSENVRQRIWLPMGAEFEANYIVDSLGIEWAGAGLSTTLRDAARFGQMILMNGMANGNQVLPHSIAQRLKTTRNVAQFTGYYKDLWYGGVTEAYHDQWWSYRDVAATAALGIHGQFIYVNTDHNVVIVKQTSDPHAEIERVDTETPMVLHAIAASLGARP